MSSERYYRCHQPVNLDLLSQFRGNNYILFDLETTGFNPKHTETTEDGVVIERLGDQITQIAAAAIAGDSLNVVGKTFNQRSQLTPEHLKLLIAETKRATAPGYQSLHWVLAFNHYHPLLQLTEEKAVTKLSRDDGTQFDFEYNVAGKLSDKGLLAFLKDQKNLPTQKDMLRKYMGWVVKQGKIAAAIGHNVHTFDKPFLNYILEDIYGLDKWGIGVIDTMWIARLLLVPAIYTLEDQGIEEAIILRMRLEKRRGSHNISSKLQDLRRVFKIDGGLAHDALGDTLSNVGVLKAIAAFLLKYREELLRDPNFIIFKNQAFTKHKFRDFKY